MGIFEDMISLGSTDLGATPESTNKADGNEAVEDLLTPKFFDSLIPDQTQDPNQIEQVKLLPTEQKRVEPTRKDPQVLNIFGLNIPSPFMSDSQKNELERLIKLQETNSPIFQDAKDLYTGNITEENAPRLIKEQSKLTNIKNQQRQEKRDTALTFSQEIRETKLSELIPIVESVVGVADLVKVRNSQEFIVNHKEPTVEQYDNNVDYLFAKKEYDAHDETLENFKTDIEREADATGGAKIASGIKQLMPFMGEMFLTKGIFSGTKKATEKIILKGFEKVIKKGIKTGAKTKLIGMAANRVLGTAVGTVTRTVAMPHRVLETALDRGTKIDADGNIQITDIELLNGFLDTYIENFSEVSGEALLKVPSKLLKKGSGAILNKSRVGAKLVNKIDDYFTKWHLKNPNGTAGQFTKSLKEVGVNNLFEEFAEERFGGGLRGAFKLEGDTTQNVFERVARGATPNSFEDLWVELGVLTVPGGANLTSSVIDNRISSKPPLKMDVGENLSKDEINKKTKEVKDNFNKAGLNVKTRYNKKGFLNVEFIGMTKDAIKQVADKAKDAGQSMSDYLKNLKTEDSGADGFIPPELGGRGIKESSIDELLGTDVGGGEGKPPSKPPTAEGFYELEPEDEGEPDKDEFKKFPPPGPLADKARLIDETIGNINSINTNIDVNIPEPTAKEHLDNDIIESERQDALDAAKDFEDQDLLGDNFEDIDSIRRDADMLKLVNDFSSEVEGLDLDSKVSDVIREFIGDDALGMGEQELDNLIKNMLDSTNLEEGGSGMPFVEFIQGITDKYSGIYLTEGMTDAQKRDAILDLDLRDITSSAQQSLNQTYLSVEVKNMVSITDKMKDVLPEEHQKELEDLTQALVDGPKNIDFVKSFADDFKLTIGRGLDTLILNEEKRLDDKKVADEKISSGIDKYIQDIKDLDDTADDTAEDLGLTEEDKTDLDASIDAVLGDQGGEGIPPVQPPTAEGFEGEEGPPELPDNTLAQDEANLKSLQLDDFNLTDNLELLNSAEEVSSELGNGSNEVIIERLNQDNIVVEDFQEGQQSAENIIQQMRNIIYGRLGNFKNSKNSENIMALFLANSHDILEIHEGVMAKWIDMINRSEGLTSDSTIGEIIDRYDTDSQFRSIVDGVVTDIRFPIESFDGLVLDLYEDSNGVITEDSSIKDLYQWHITKFMTALGNARVVATFNDIGKNLEVDDIEKIFKKHFAEKDGNIISNTASAINNIYDDMLKNAKGDTDIVDLNISPELREGINRLDAISKEFENEDDSELLSIEQVKLIEDNQLLFSSALGSIVRNLSDNATMKVGERIYNKTEIQDAKSNVIDGLGKNRSLMGPLGDAINKSTSGILTSQNIKPEYLARLLTGYKFDNAVYQILGLGIQDGLNKSAAFEQIVYDALRTKLKEVDGLQRMSRSLGKVANKRTKTQSLGGKNIKLTPMELLDIYMTLRQAEGRTHVVDTYKNGVKVTNKQGFAIDKSQFDKVEKGKATGVVFFTGGLSPSEVNGVRNQVENDVELMKVLQTFDEIGVYVTAQLNLASKEIIGTKIADKQDYWHLEVQQFGKKIGKEIIHKSLNQIEGYGAYKTRVNSDKPLVVRDALHRFVSLIKANGNYVGMAKPIRQVGTLLNDDKFRENLIQKGYKNELDAYTTILHNATNRTTQSTFAHIIQTVNSKAASGILSLNIPVVLLQNMSSMLYPTVMDSSAYISTLTIPEQMARSAKNMVMFAGKAVTPEVARNLISTTYDECMEKSPVFWLRQTEGNVNPELTRSTQQTIKSNVQGKKTPSDYLNALIKKSDTIALIDGWALTKREVSNFIKNPDGLTNPAARQWYQAWVSMGKEIPTEIGSDAYWNMVNARSQYVWTATQPSFNAFEKTSNNSSKDAAKAIIFAFRSYWDTVTSLSNDTFKRVGYDAQQFGKGRATWNLMKNGISIYTGLALASMLKDIVGNLVGRRERDFGEIGFNALFPLFNLIPWLGPMAQQVISATVGELTEDNFGLRFGQEKISFYTFELGLPGLDFMMSILKDTTRDIGKVYDTGGDLSAEEIQSMIFRTANNAAKTRGLNIKDFYKIEETIRKEDETFLEKLPDIHGFDGGTGTGRRTSRRRRTTRARPTRKRTSRRRRR